MARKTPQLPDTTSLRTRPLRIIAQDPSITFDKEILTATVDVRAEALAAGPWGHRVQVIDYDASTHTLYKPRDAEEKPEKNEKFVDPAIGMSDHQLLTDPHFHAQNVYAIVMRTLARFEQALGRRVPWGFNGHQLKVVPHAFADANAFYSREDEALLFGYFPDEEGEIVFCCLSHDVVAHETTHALLDGLRTRFTDPSSPDQAAFHEGFADIVALLSVFALPEVADKMLDLESGVPIAKSSGRPTVSKERVTVDAINDSMLGLAEQMGKASQLRGHALRCSTEITPSPKLLTSDEYREPHRRGEILVAAVLNAFVAVWASRIDTLGTVAENKLDRQRVAEEGADAADYLLTMAIRAIDYTPVVHMTFRDYLSALLTADYELRPDDSRYEYRKHLRDSFAAFGIDPIVQKDKPDPPEPGLWNVGYSEELRYSRTHFEPMTRDADEVFWFIWENRIPLKVHDGAYGHVLSVRPSLRIAPDGFAMKETVVEFLQVLQVNASELAGMKISKPEQMPDSMQLYLYGGNTLLFDEYGRLKYNIHSDITDEKRQSARIQYLWDSGYYTRERDPKNFSELHLVRAMNATRPNDLAERW